MSKTTRQVKRTVSTKMLAQGFSKLAMIAENHERQLNQMKRMLHTIDNYIENLEKLLISKNILTQDECEKAAQDAVNKTESQAKEAHQVPLAPLNANPPTTPSVILTDANKPDIIVPKIEGSIEL